MRCGLPLPHRPIPVQRHQRLRIYQLVPTQYLLYLRPVLHVHRHHLSRLADMRHLGLEMRDEQEYPLVREAGRGYD